MIVDDSVFDRGVWSWRGDSNIRNLLFLCVPRPRALAGWHRLASGLVRLRVDTNRFDHLAIAEPESVGESEGLSGSDHVQRPRRWRSPHRAVVPVQFVGFSGRDSVRAAARIGRRRRTIPVLPPKVDHLGCPTVCWETEL